MFDDSPGEETAVVLYDVALTLTDLIANNCLPETYDFANLPKKISDLANKAVTWCPAGNTLYSRILVTVLGWQIL